MWDLPGPGLEPMSPALAGRFSTTAPPGKSLHISFVKRNPLMLCQGLQDRRLVQWLTEVRKVVMLTDTIYSKKVQFKISECKRHIGKSPGDQAQASRCPLWRRCTDRQQLILPEMTWHNTYRLLWTRDAHLRLRARGSWWGSGLPGMEQPRGWP